MILLGQCWKSFKDAIGQRIKAEAVGIELQRGNILCSRLFVTSFEDDAEDIYCTRVWL